MIQVILGQRSYYQMEISRIHIELKFVPALFKCLIGLEDGYQVDLQTGDFGDLIGFTKNIVTATSYGDKLPDRSH